ncbi:hypothetical protein DMA15_12785 [Streptomyces sp. WAC 01529]|uniref:hypothetical protein n=1 Tax=Streptomyces sp. WAC 01529 TaxID=2203205 RepID=UPI000F6CC1D1|nr:hypothetical protein [Streptomyces sp. WAC 01529]AZM53350.1 hypothetical protein DMA15_12785 [Streptomyces sp. WAC 01529]
MAHAEIAPPAPSTGLILSLTVRTSLEHTAEGKMFGVVMLTYPAPQFGEVDQDDVELKMRGVAASLGAAPYGGPVPTVGARIHMQGADAALWFKGCDFGLRLKHPRWASAAARLDEVLLVVGLAELSPGATRAEVDEYRVHLATNRDLYVARTQIAPPNAVHDCVAAALRRCL